VEFQINGEPHYGWMGILPGDGFAIRMDIVDWAYEALPQTPLRAWQIPEPSGALLVLGAFLLMALRHAR